MDQVNASGLRKNTKLHFELIFLLMFIYYLNFHFWLVHTVYHAALTKDQMQQKRYKNTHTEGVYLGQGSIQF